MSTAHPMPRPALVAALGALTSTLMFASASPAEAATLKQRALKIAAAQKGDPYKYGAAGPDKFDCSGLTSYSYKKAGKKIPRTAQGQYNASRRIGQKAREKGDLVFIGRSSGSIYHVGIYAGFWDGKGWMWNANSKSYRGRKVVLAPIREYTKGAPRAFYGQVKP
ncbi:C40 family peptidase [Streptomyces albidoflavus]|uniref:C40 family peptidase n=1 Tax=Streptomyces albidoflavus TaxID=1886 RepID=UPI0033C72B9C